MPISSSAKTEYCQPFLRWAGGKNWMIKHLPEIIKSNRFNGYHEPFLGGGSVFFSLPKHKKTYLSDVNRDLILTYEEVRDNVEGIIEHLHDYKNTADYYYEIRSQQFIDRTERAAQFIYLNQTSFNGIYRVNLKGVYNVPFGYRKKNFLQPDVLMLASKKLKGVKLKTQEFQATLSRIKEGDLVFLDPPYTITHNNNGFIKYNEKMKLFSLEDQKRLADFIRNIVDKGAYYVLTNAAHKDVKEIFNINKPIELKRASLVGGKNAPRGKYAEYIFTNIQ